LRQIKQLASEKLPKDWPLREVLLQEKEEISPEEFLAKLQIWLTLLRFEGETR
jgi:hypothetical protein